MFPVDAAKTYQMTRLPWRLVVLLAAVLLGTCAAIVDTTTAFACSCAGISTTRALREADAVFRGTVVSKEVVGHGDAARTDIRFAVDRVYKGAVFDEQVVASEHDEDACGLDPDAVSRLITTLCNGNLPTGIAPAVLGAPRPPLNGVSDREERSTNADRIVTRGIAYAGIGALCIGALAVIGLGVLWRPGRSR